MEIKSKIQIRISEGSGIGIPTIQTFSYQNFLRFPVHLKIWNWNLETPNAESRWLFPCSAFPNSNFLDGTKIADEEILIPEN
jgi:hypothetical protein